MQDLTTSLIARENVLNNQFALAELEKKADKDDTRDTMYTEVLKAIGSFECGLAEQIEFSEALKYELICSIQEK
ncbi:hypothetical protein [Gallibacterium anatis]|uniref:Uncharacterized protein n=1 Tax=Gallibacterium anatis TaxID=750 RepID=A0A1A7PB19_9PAST|nr:hypothetical protein [Gallibacterium anatis]OBW92264.1 hypothetical protein QV02_10340 [Gallibacterium anatis]OBW98896.1 hypothetical protein QV03_05505 [Gallibacterium anatis]